jgi:spore maturation protein CgeB
MDAVRPVVGTTAHSHLFTWRSAHVSAFQEAGFQNVSELPLATNPNRCFPKELSVAEKKRFGGAVSFVGASLVRQGMHYRDIFLESYAQWSGNEDGAEKLEKLMCAQRINWNQFAIPELLSLFFPRFSDAMKNAQVSLSSLLGESVASEKRMHYVRSLCVHQIAIWGDRDWGVLPGYRGYAGHLKEVVQIYRGSSINVDINRIYQSDIVTMRVFDVIASGSFVLTEYTPALEPLFEVGTEIETYRTLSELHEKIEYYQSHPEKRTEIIEAGRARILKEHTMQHRMNSIFTAISQR